MPEYKYTLYAWRSDDEGDFGICKCGDFTPNLNYHPESGWRARPSVKIGDFNTAEELAELAEISIEEANEWFAEINMKDSPKIIISKSAHGTADVVVHNLPSIKMVDFFMLFDIWGSRGYDRFNDDGLYFEVPTFVYDIIEDIPFIKTNHIEVVKK